MYSDGDYAEDNEFVSIRIPTQGRGRKDCSPTSVEDDPFYSKWLGNASAEHSSPELFGADALRKLYPSHSLVMSADWRLNLINIPGVASFPLDESKLVTNLVFVPLARRLGGIPGVLVESVEFGSFRLVANDKEFILFTVQWFQGFGKTSQHFLLHEGPEGPARELFLQAGIWQDGLHNEIWVFAGGFWSKDHGLWTEVQKADWDHIILSEEFKKALQKDVYGFFAAENIYKELAIPWKRGLIMFGPPGNGKTITVKVIMKTCTDAGFLPLYVKSFKSYKGEEGGIADVFAKARQMSPCVLILEDLDSLITDQNRSFFLNQLDGIEGNDGLLVIGTTNHFEKLDPGLSKRPSRFDRKYSFGDPNRDERALYAKYWQGKLKDNRAITFPDSLVDKIADNTNRFSFAYLKEAFVSSLVILAGIDTDKPSFSSIILEQIEALRSQLDSSSTASVHPSPLCGTAEHGGGRDIRGLLDSLSDSIAKSGIIPPRTLANYRLPPDMSDGRDVRVLLDALSDSIEKSEIRSRISHIYDIQGPARPHAVPEDGPDFRVLLDQMANDGSQKGRQLAGRMFASRGPSREPVYVAERDQSLHNRFDVPGPGAVDGHGLPPDRERS